MWPRHHGHSRPSTSLVCTVVTITATGNPVTVACVKPRHTLPPPRDRAVGTPLPTSARGTFSRAGLAAAARCGPHRKGASNTPFYRRAKEEQRHPSSRAR
ncbi:unnamed protein product [Rangifer tarandus platyrhynchus]|uniref:Uncharacterized protein n=1 Tax=Rangifer tarandus platyrhynchus TaxID=3082113 RepID=A0AC59ZGV9_RANTA